MKHLFASCAVIALMAAPALAQSTFEPTDPLVESEQALDPTMREEPAEATDFEREAEPVADAEPVDEADAETSDETVAETDPSTEKSMTAETPVTDDGETALEAEATNDETTVADSEPMFGTETVADAGTFEAPIDVAELPEEYSTADLNAMMLAQLNVVAVEIADAQAASGTNVYASTQPMADTTDSEAQTYAGTESAGSLMENERPGSTGDLAMTDPATPGDMMSSEDAMTQSPPDGSGARTDAYASTDRADPAMSPEGNGGSFETALSDTAPADDATTQGYDAAQSMTDPTTDTAEDYASVNPDGTPMETEATDPSFGTAMTEAAPADEAATQGYAATDNTTESTTENYASTEAADTAVETEAVEPAAETAVMADETDDSVQMAEQTDGMMVTAEGDIDQTTVEIASQDDRFTTLVELVGLAGLEDSLDADGPYTVFAPTNEAFAALPEETLTRLKSEEGKAELVEILQSHVAEGRLMAGEVPMAGQSVETIGDASLNVTGSVDGTLNIEGSNTVGDGIYASNGVVYAVDAVILPEATPEPAVTPEN